MCFLANYNSLLVLFFRLLKGRTFPGKVLLTRKFEPPNVCTSPEHTEEFERSHSENDLEPSDWVEISSEVRLTKFMILVFYLLLHLD